MSKDNYEENDDRMNIIGQNGNDGLHYDKVVDSEGSEESKHFFESLRTGDEVYWNDPDEGICSGHATFVGHMSHNDPDTYTFYVDGVSVIEKDGIKMQVFTKELS